MLDPGDGPRLRSGAERGSNFVKFTFGSLFAGIGGFDLGFERAGMECVWQVENNPYAINIPTKHWPNVIRHDDIRTFPRIEWRKDAAIGTSDFECPDLICGGPPCQRTSNAAAIQGKKTGETLWPEMFRVLSVMRPRFVVVEQPCGNKKWEGQVEADLAGAGWTVSRFQLEACRFGAPHQRRRVFFVADAAQKRCDTGGWQRDASAIEKIAWPLPPR